MSNIKKAFFIIVVFLVFLGFYQREKIIPVLASRIDLSWLSFKNPEPAELRRNYIMQAKDELRVGVMGPVQQLKDEGGLLFAGIELAFAEFEERSDSGLKLCPVYRDDQFSMLAAEVAATEFLNDSGMVAIIGPWSSGIALSVLPLFNYGDLLVLLPDASSDKISALGYKKMFRQGPKSSQYAFQMAGTIAADGHKSVILINYDNEYGNNLSDAVQNELQWLGVQTSYRLEYDELCDEHFFRRSFADIAKLYQADAVFVVANVPLWQQAVSIMRQSGIKSSLYISEQSYADDFLLRIPELEGATFFGSVNFQDEKVQDFVRRFQEKYGKKPDSLAIYGYETVMTLINALENTASRLPSDLARTIRNTPRNSLYGRLEFDQKGDLINPQIVVKKILGGRITETPVRADFH